jgi:hypothetical protein
MSNAFNRDPQRKMSDMPPLPSRPALTLPPAQYPARKAAAPQQPPPPVSKPEPKVAPLDVAEALFHGCMRDGANVSLVFLDASDSTRRQCDWSLFVSCENRGRRRDGCL